MVKAQAKIEDCLMPYSTEQQQRLNALGIQLFEVIPRSVEIVDNQTRALDNSFWQTRLGQNIQRVAKDIDLSELINGNIGRDCLAKRMLWQKIRLHLKSK